MQDQEMKACFAFIEALLKESQAVHDRAAEAIRQSQEALRDAKEMLNVLDAKTSERGLNTEMISKSKGTLRGANAMLNMLREKLRRSA